MSPESLAKDEHLGARVLPHDPSRSRRSLFVCSAIVTTGIAAEMVQKNTSELEMHPDRQERLTQGNSPADDDWRVRRNPITWPYRTGRKLSNSSRQRNSPKE